MQWKEAYKKDISGIKDEKEKNKTLKGLVRFFKRNGFDQVGDSKYYYRKILY